MIDKRTDSNGRHRKTEKCVQVYRRSRQLRTSVVSHKWTRKLGAKRGGTCNIFITVSYDCNRIRRHNVVTGRRARSKAMRHTCVCRVNCVCRIKNITCVIIYYRLGRRKRKRKRKTSANDWICCKMDTFQRHRQVSYVGRGRYEITLCIKLADYL